MQRLVKVRLDMQSTSARDLCMRTAAQIIQQRVRADLHTVINVLPAGFRSEAATQPAARLCTAPVCWAQT
jgi:hypothetical protein